MLLRIILVIIMLYTSYQVWSYMTFPGDMISDFEVVHHVEEEEKEDDTIIDTINMFGFHREVIVPAWRRLHEAVVIVEEPQIMRPADRQTVVIRSDTQNVHDSVVVQSVRSIIHSLPAVDETCSVIEIRNEFPQCSTILDRIESNTYPVVSLQMTETQALCRVYNYCKTHGCLDILRIHLEELEKQTVDQSTPCTSGRVAHLADVIVCHTIEKPSFRMVTRDILRHEFNNKAAMLSKEGKLTKETLKELLVMEYVKPGICREEDIDFEIDQWVDVF